MYPMFARCKATLPISLADDARDADDSSGAAPSVMHMERGNENEEVATAAAAAALDGVDNMNDVDVENKVEDARLTNSLNDDRDEKRRRRADGDNDETDEVDKVDEVEKEPLTKKPKSAHGGIRYGANGNALGGRPKGDTLLSKVAKTLHPITSFFPVQQQQETTQPTNKSTLVEEPADVALDVGLNPMMPANDAPDTTADDAPTPRPDATEDFMANSNEAPLESDCEQVVEEVKEAGDDDDDKPGDFLCPSTLSVLAELAFVWKELGANQLSTTLDEFLQRAGDRNQVEINPSMRPQITFDLRVLEAWGHVELAVLGSDGNLRIMRTAQFGLLVGPDNRRVVERVSSSTMDLEFVQSKMNDLSLDIVQKIDDAINRGNALIRETVTSQRDEAVAAVDGAHDTVITGAIIKSSIWKANIYLVFKVIV
jgi:hypothetical protein